MLKKFPKTTFVGHADAFWANVDATGVVAHVLLAATA
jgi:hypothetical protein